MKLFNSYAIFYLGLVVRPRSTKWREHFPLFLWGKMKELSIFVDESGDFGDYKSHSPYYIVSLVLHEQHNSIETSVVKLDEKLSAMGLKKHNIHTAPLVRREQSYKNTEREKRIKIFDSLFHFIRTIKISYKTFLISKSKNYTQIDITSEISKQLSSFLKDNLLYFQSFNRVIIYYDNGQTELTKVLVSVFNALISNVEFKRVYPLEYKLFQAADFICTLKLIYIKSCNKQLSISEEKFFGSERNFKKKYLKYIEKLEFK